MKVQFFANHCDTSTSDIASDLSTIFDELACKLESDYGGTIEHLWIDFELSEMSIKAFGTLPKPFRFQKRVSGASRLGLPAIPDSYNVGHYSVRPDFDILKSNSKEQNVKYSIELIYQSTELLYEKKKRLAGFDVDKFRRKFKSASQEIGIELNDAL